MSAPYWTSSDGRLVIYHGRAEDVLPTLAPVDLLLTDPPYGIASVWQGGFGRGWKQSAKTEAAIRNEWDERPPDGAFLRVLLELSQDAVIWGGNYFDLPLSRGWLIWNKPERGFSLADAELAWTTRDMVIRVADLPRSEPGRVHPTQKPVALMKWCLRFFPKARTVLDPYMGSGTTLVAAMSLGLACIGVEADEHWCEYAARRLEDPPLLAAIAAPEQADMFAEAAS